MWLPVVSGLLQGDAKGEEGGTDFEEATGVDGGDGVDRKAVVFVVHGHVDEFCLCVGPCAFGAFDESFGSTGDPVVSEDLVHVT